MADVDVAPGIAFRLATEDMRDEELWETAWLFATCAVREEYGELADRLRADAQWAERVAMLSVAAAVLELERRRVAHGQSCPTTQEQAVIDVVDLAGACLALADELESGALAPGPLAAERLRRAVPRRLGGKGADDED